MATTFAILAALPREVQLLVAGVRPDPVLAKSGISLYRLERCVVVAAGMGSARVSLAFEAAMRCGEVTEAISVGLAGACDPELQPGTVVEAAQVIDVRTGERFAATGPVGGPLLASTEAIASVAEKARLRAAYGAAVVDMEAATVARLARGQGIRFAAIKGVSDAHDFELASLARFADRQGQFRTAAFALHTALHPGEWGAAMTVGRNSTRALAALTARIKARLVETA